MVTRIMIMTMISKTREKDGHNEKILLSDLNRTHPSIYKIRLHAQKYN